MSITNFTNLVVQDGNLMNSNLIEIYDDITDNGNLPLLQYLLDQGLVDDDPLDNFASQSASSGQIEILKFILHHDRQKSHPDYSLDTILAAAAQGGHMHIVLFLIQTYSNHISDLSLALQTSLERNHLDIYYYLSSL